MNTPLGTIHSTRDTLTRTIDKLKKNLEVDEIIRSLRNFARLDEAEYQMADLHEGIESTLTLLQAQMAENITVVRDYAEIEPVYCAPGQLNQAFMSLLKNALQAMDGTG